MAAHSFAKIAREFRALPRANKSIAELYRDALKLARQAVPFDGWAALTLDPATFLVTGGVHEDGLSRVALERWLELEYAEGDFLHFPALARELTPVSLLSDATRGELVKSARYREVLSPAGYQHELRAALRSMKQTWGGLVLLRRTISPNFVPDDESFLRELGDALGDAVRSTLRAANVATDTRAGRALLLLDENQKILQASPGSAAVLAEFSEGSKDVGGLPHTVRSTVNGARRGAERGAQVSAYVRVKGKSGAWLTVHAALLGDRQVLVTIEEGRLIPLAAPLCAAYDLSPLQADVLRDVLLGIDDAQIAERNNVAALAVEAELRSLIEKVGVERREELAKKLFVEHYRARALASAPLDADGFFAVSTPS